MKKYNLSHTCIYCKFNNNFSFTLYIFRLWGNSYQQRTEGFTVLKPCPVSMVDYYKVLGVNKQATETDIKKA